LQFQSETIKLFQANMNGIRVDNTDLLNLAMTNVDYMPIVTLYQLNISNNKHAKADQSMILLVTQKQLSSISLSIHG